MNLTTIYSRVKSLAENDQSIVNTDIDGWLDSAINKINQMCQSKFPVVSGNAGTYTPQFDDRYHDALVLFAVGRYRESDSDYNGASYFMNQFDSMVRDMQRDMYIPYCFRKDYNVYSFTYDTAKSIWDIDLPPSAYYGTIIVYIAPLGNAVNEKRLDPKYYTINADDNTITLKATYTFALTDIISLNYEANAAFESPPYGNWIW